MSDSGEMRTYYYSGSLANDTNAFIQAAVEAGHHNLDMDDYDCNYCELEKMYDGAEAVALLSEPQIRSNTPPPQVSPIPVLTNPTPEANCYPISPGMKGTLRRVTTISYESPVKVLNGYATPQLISPSKFLSKLHCDEEMPEPPPSGGDDESPEKPKREITLNLQNVVRETARSMIRYLHKKNPDYVRESELTVVIEAHLKTVFPQYVENRKLYNYLKNCRPIVSTITLFLELGLIRVRNRDEERITPRNRVTRSKKYIVNVTEYQLVSTIPNMHTLKKLL